MNRKHYRSTTINRIEDFEMHPEDQKKILENIAENSTMGTPIRDNSILFPNNEIGQQIENIQTELKVQANFITEKKKILRNQVLELFFKNKDSSPIKPKKKLKRSNNSIGRLPKKSSKMVQPKTKLKLDEVKGRKNSAAAPKSKNPHFISLNLPKFSARTGRTGSTNVEYKASFLV